LGAFNKTIKFSIVKQQKQCYCIVTTKQVMVRCTTGKSIGKSAKTLNRCFLYAILVIHIYFISENKFSISVIFSENYSLWEYLLWSFLPV